MKRLTALSITVLLIVSMLLTNAACSASDKSFILATTTSTYDSGLLDFILPVFEEKTGWEVKVVSVGTGAAMQHGRDGEADVLLVHARSQEDAFIADGYATERFDVMYNDFVIVGPADGPLQHSTSIAQTLSAIYEQNLLFMSRGDESGTHTRELALWKKLDLTPEDNEGYRETGQGMGDTLGMTSEMNAYTLSDRATWLSYSNKGNLVIICENDPELLNPYGVIIVSSTKKPNGAQLFVEWIRSAETQTLIGSFGVAEYGQSLFFPDA